MTDEPATAIVDDEVHLGIVKQAGDFRMAGDKRQVAGIDFDNSEVFDAGQLTRICAQEPEARPIMRTVSARDASQRRQRRGIGRWSRASCRC